MSELRAGMPELSKFNVLPFIAYKNMCLPQCALEKVKRIPFNFPFYSFIFFSVWIRVAEGFEFNGERDKCSS